MHKAQFYKTLGDKKVQCLLCPHKCTIYPDKRGICNVRINKNGELFSEVYEKVSSYNFDPIEKKPLAHFHPGSTIFSFGSVGCNLKCRFCQNSDISQKGLDAFPDILDYKIDSLIRIAKNDVRNIGIAYTYNEPFIWYEFLYDMAVRAKEEGLLNVVVSNGFVNPEPLKKILPIIDAFNIDLKAFTNKFYKEMSAGSVEPVKETLKIIAASGKYMEITNLVIPTQNDSDSDFEEMVKWIANELGEETVLHVTRYFPRYKLDIHATPAHILFRLKDIASKYLKHVYVGNV